MTLQEFITFMDKQMVQRFNERGEIFPMWHAITARGEHKVLPSPPGFDKDTIAVLVRAYFALNDVVRYCFVDEAWQLHVDDASDMSQEEIDALFAKGIHDHPNRVEVIMYSAEDDTGQITARRVIKRSLGGRAIVGPLEIDERFKQSEGRFVGMLPVRGRMQ